VVSFCGPPCRACNQFTENKIFLRRTGDRTDASALPEGTQKHRNRIFSLECCFAERHTNTRCPRDEVNSFLALFNCRRQMVIVPFCVWTLSPLASGSVDNVRRSTITSDFNRSPVLEFIAVTDPRTLLRGSLNLVIKTRGSGPVGWGRHYSQK